MHEKCKSNRDAIADWKSKVRIPSTNDKAAVKVFLR